MADKFVAKRKQNHTAILKCAQLGYYVRLIDTNAINLEHFNAINQVSIIKFS